MAWDPGRRRTRRASSAAPSARPASCGCHGRRSHHVAGRLPRSGRDRHRARGTRLFAFRPTVFTGVGLAGEPTWQGQSHARNGTSPAASLKVLSTTNLKPGTCARNGAPYSARTVVTEYWELHTLPNKDEWLTVTTRVEDPLYLSRSYLTSSDFKKLPTSAGWNPTPCSTK
jgi:hypothetical protein